MKKTKTSWFKKNQTTISLIAIILLNFLLRIPSLWEPVSYGDECIYLSLGQALRKGAVFYRDIHDNKPPLLYLMAALANGKLSYFRAISLIWNSINIWLIALVAQKLTKKQWTGPLAASLFLIFSLFPEGWVANGELFMIMPATLAFWLVLKAKEKKQTALWFLAGLCFSVAFLFKVPVGFDFAGFLLAFFVFKIKKLKNLLGLFKDKNLYLTLMGFLLPIFLSIFYYAQKNAFTPYVRSALLQNIGYLSSWGGSNSGLYQRAIILLLVTGLIWRWRKQLGFSFYSPVLITAFGLFGVFLAERPYPHYLIEIAPWAALFLTVLFVQKRAKQFIISTLIIFLTLLGVIKFNFWWYPLAPYYRNFARFALGQIDKQEYFRFFGDKTLDDYQLARYLKNMTQPNEPLFVWGDSACVYALAERTPIGRYTVAYHIKDFDGFEETIQATKKEKSQYIIKLSNEKTNFPQLESLLASHYVLAKKIGNALVYYRLFP